MKPGNELVLGREQRQLQQLRERFEVWRRDHPGRPRLPGELWSEAANVAQQCGVYRTAKMLRLGYDSLKQHVQVGGLGGGKAARTPRFVELRPVTSAGRSECSVELENVRGAKIKIELNGGAVSELPNLARLLWREL